MPVIDRWEDGGRISPSPDNFAAISVSGERGNRALFTNLSFQLRAGEALFLEGPNGSGKSSLLRLIAGFGRPSQGTLCWNGQSIHRDMDAHHRRMQWIAYQDAIKPALTTLEMLGFWTALAGNPVTQDLPAALATLGIISYQNMPCRLLSSGQRKRLALARLLTISRQFWLLDEPTVGLDHAGRETLSAMINTHLRRGGLAIIATHQPIARIPGQVITLADFSEGHARRSESLAPAQQMPSPPNPVQHDLWREDF